MENKRKYAFIYSYGFLIFGFNALILGSVLPAIEMIFNINHSQAGILLTANPIGFMIGTIVCTVIASVRGPFKISTISMGIAALGILGVVLSNGLVLLYTSFAVMGFGLAMFETATGISISYINYKNTGSVLNLMHSFYALGAIVSPFIISIFISDINTWWYAYVISIASFVFFLFIATPINKIPYEDGRKGKKDKDKFYALSESSFWIIIISVILYVGSEIGFSSWAATYIFEVKKASISLSAIFPALLWGGLYVGRLLSGFLVEKVGYVNILIFMNLLSFLSFFMVLLLNNLVFISIGVFLVGLGFATIFPTLQALLIRRVRKGVSFAIGTFTFAASLGSIITNYLVGFIGEKFGLQYGIAFIFMFIAGLLGLSLLLKKDERKYVREV